MGTSTDRRDCGVQAIPPRKGISDCILPQGQSGIFTLCSQPGTSLKVGRCENDSGYGRWVGIGNGGQGFDLGDQAASINFEIHRRRSARGGRFQSL